MAALLSFPSSFEPVPIDFDFTNEEWCLAHLVFCRFAMATLVQSEPQLRQMVRGIADAEMLGGLQADFERTRLHLSALAATIEVAEARLMIVGEGL